MGGFSKGGSPIETETERIISPMEKLGKRANGHSVFQQGAIVVSGPPGLTGMEERRLIDGCGASGVTGSVLRSNPYEHAAWC